MSMAVVLVSANTEWRILLEMIPRDIRLSQSPFGEWFAYPLVRDERIVEIIILHGGWGKISAAASTQYAIDTWHPSVLINIGTCGGFEGKVDRGDILMAGKTLVYDIYEKMGDPDEHLAQYTTKLDLSWVREPYPIRVKQTILVSADRDLDVEEIPSLAARFGAIAGDWESGAIAFVAQRNNTRCLILKGVSDIVGMSGGEAYDNKGIYVEGTRRVMKILWESLPQWLGVAGIFDDSHRHIE
ncbi:5'-methylthioadenosine/S-adenosylhomocysteine nucleosidase [bacterium]|nr:5'-methylthioadenosine/S-adenosylhomocysteine nucleosidase [candidate division CSSED10-310 bacterium]